MISLFLLAVCRSIDGFIFVMFALKSLTAVVALDLNFDWAEQKIQDAKIHSLDKETRGKTKKNPEDWEENLRWRLSGYGGQEIYETAKWQMPQTPATNTHTHIHTYSSIMQMPQWKIFLWHLWRRTHFRWQQVERTAPCRTDQAKMGSSSQDSRKWGRDKDGQGERRWGHNNN